MPSPIVEGLRRGGERIADFALPPLDVAAQMGLGMVKQPLTGLYGAGSGLAELLRTGSLEKAGMRGGEAVGEAGKFLDEYTPGLQTEGGKRLAGNIGQAVETVEKGVGDALGNPIDKLGEVSPALAGGALAFMEVADPTKKLKRAKTAAKEAAKAIDTAAAVVDAPKAVDVAKRFQGGEKAGTYRGTEAFGGITPQRLGVMRKDYLNAMEEGAGQRDWYDRASDTIYRLTGESEAGANRLADAAAITSARTPVGANLMYSNKGWNQDLVGDPIRTGGFPTAHGKQIEQTWADATKGEGLGLKRSPYRAGLSVKWQGPEAVKRATHDIHDVRAWGITDPKTGGPWSKGVAPAGHRFLDEQADWARDTANARQLGGLGGWNLHNAQAAAWIAQKAKRKGMTVDEAGKDYTDFVPDYSASITREWTPGETSGHLPELLRAGPDVRREYADALESSVRGPQGIDQLAHQMGMLTDTTLPNRGVYEGQLNPGYASQVLVGKGGGSLAMDPASRRASESVAAAHGLLGLQDQVALNYLGGEAPIKSAGAFQVATGLRSPFSDEALANVSRIASEHGGDIAQVDPRGARVLAFHPEGDPRRKALLEALRSEYPHADVTPMARDSSLFPLREGSDWQKPETFSTKPYIEKIEAGGPKMVAGFDTAMQGMAPKMLATTEALAAKHGLTQAPYYKPMMEALSTRGLAGLKELVAKGIVPMSAYLLISGGEDEGAQ